MLISMYFGGAARYYDPIATLHRVGMVSLLLTSVIYLGCERPMAWIGLVSCVILLLWGTIFTYNVS